MFEEAFNIFSQNVQRIGLDLDRYIILSFILFIFIFLVEKLMSIKIFGPSGFVESLKLSWRNIKS